MRPVQTFWRNHAKPRPLPRTRHVVTHQAPEPGSATHIRQLMKQATEDAAAAGTPRPLYAFEVGDVAAIYTHKHDVGPGIWFVLHDGRVFDGNGEPDTRDPAAYDDPGATAP